MTDLGGGDGRKSGQGVLSFRSRKLLRGSLSKNAEVVVEKKRADARNARELFQADNLQKESASDTRSKAERELWDPRKVESEAAKARASARKARKKQPVQSKELGIDQVSLPQEQLPQKYKLLETFYEGLEAAYSLLRIRRQMCTVRAVSKIVESISKRRFLLKYLAQMKHIIPEVLQLEYVRCKDPDTWDEKWDLRITLLPISSDSALSNSPLKGSPGQSTQTVRRRKEFHTRLLQFASLHPESGDIPEDPLPQRPLGGNLPVSSPLANRKINTEAGLRSTAVVDSPAELNGEDDSLKFVVPSERDHDSVKVPGTPHFPTSFKPFFSVRHSGDGLSTQNPLQHRDEVEQIGHHFDIDEAVTEAGAGELGGTPHFPASFKPHFSVRRPADAPIDALSSETSGQDVQQLQQPVDDGEVESEAGSSAKLDSDAKLFDATFHFPASFRPFFSNRPAADATDGGCVQFSRDSRPDVCGTSALPCVEKRANVEAACESHLGSTSRSDDDTWLPEGTPHFPGFRRPFFSVKRTGDVTEGGRPQFWKTFCPDEVRGCEDEQDANSTPGDMHPPKSLSPKYVPPAGSSSPVDRPSFRSVFSLSTDSQPTPSPSPQGTPKLKHLNPAASPIPTHTPASLSPMNSYRTAQETPVRMVSKSSSADFFVDTPPPKSHGIMRSLKFGSPVNATRPASLADHDRALKSSGPNTPLQSSLLDSHAVVSASVSPSTPASAVPGNVFQASPFSPPSSAGNALHYNPRLLSPVKYSKSRSLQFNSPTKELSRNDLTPGQGRLHPTPSPLSGAVVKPPQVASSQNAIPSSSPQTPALRSPVKAPRGKEILNSPPKRTKLNRLSLFGKEDDQSQKSRWPSVTEIGGNTHTDSNAAEGSLAGQCVSGPVCDQDTSVKPKLIQTLAAKDMRRMSASDLDILQNLPVDLVQSVLEKEKRLSVEATMELAKQKRQQQMMSGVPKLFNQLRLIFQSLNRSVLPRNELIKSILTSHPDITDRGEVEERLQLLVELVPEYMTTTSSHSGELLYRIDKKADVVQIQRRLSAGI